MKISTVCNFEIRHSSERKYEAFCKVKDAVMAHTKTIVGTVHTLGPYVKEKIIN